MAYCFLCDRWFDHDLALNQHIENSAAHRVVRYECDWCDRTFASEHARHQHHSSAAGHPYCVACRRMFGNENNLRQHLHSRTHVGSSITCPWCHEGFATASGATVHLESGACAASGLNKHKVDSMIRAMDRRNVITRPMLELPGYDDGGDVVATQRTWNGAGYECHPCHRDFGKLQGLNMHLRSPVHQQRLYWCPQKTCAKEFKSLSGLVMHFESESCGVMRFGAVQQQARTRV